MVTIADDDTPLELSINSPAVGEDETSGEATLTVTLSAESGQDRDSETRHREPDRR